MIVKRLHQFLIPEKVSRRQLLFWFSLSLTFAVMFGLMGLREAFSAEYIVQDDARQHVFWMQRFLDPTLFPNDLLADYYQSIAPAGYTAIYRIAASIGIHPLLFNKLLPMILGVITTGYCFWVCLELLPVPFAGFIGSLLLNQNLWLHDDLASATARAFMYPIFLAFIYYFLRRSLIPCLVTIALQGLFYPHFVFIMSGLLILRLLHWDGRLRLSRDRQDYLFCIVGLAVAFGVMLPYALDVSDFGGPITRAAALSMPEFYKGGRTYFFTSSPWQYWLTGQRSGALIWVMPLCILAPIALIVAWSKRDRFPLMQQARHLSILVQIEAIGLALFLTAHAVLFRLYLPARYSQINLILLSALAAAVAIPVFLDSLFNWAERQAQSRVRQSGAIATTVLLALLLLLSPELFQFPDLRYKAGTHPAIYQFLAQQPKDALVASLSLEADNIPTFSGRSVLVSREYALPYQAGYYRQIQQRVNDLLRAQYSRDLAELQQVIRTYGIDFWLLDRAYLRSPNPKRGDEMINTWLQQFQPTFDQVKARQNTPSAISSLIPGCTAVKDGRFVLLDATCLSAASPKQPTKKNAQKSPTPSPSAPAN